MAQGWDVSERTLSAINIDNGLDACSELRLHPDVVRRYVVFVRHHVHRDMGLRVDIWLFRAKGESGTRGRNVIGTHQQSSPNRELFLSF